MCSITVVASEMESRSRVRYQCINLRIVQKKLKNSDITKCWQRFEAIWIFICCWWEHKIINQLEELCGQIYVELFKKELWFQKVQHASDQWFSNFILTIFPREIKRMSTRMFIVSLIHKVQKGKERKAISRILDKYIFSYIHIII